MLRDMKAFDDDHAEALRGLWFLGDVHGEFSHLAKALLAAARKPDWVIFAGDIDIDHISFAEVLAPLRRNFPGTRVAFIYGNHDADTYDHWNCLHNCGDAVALHSKVVELSGIRVAGLGGNFLGQIWAPPNNPTFRNRDAAMNRGAYLFRDSQRPNPSLLGAIYPNEFEHLARQQADILVTHEAPGCHPYGWEAISQLSRDMRVARSFHGHQHDDRSEEYCLQRDTLKFDARALAYCGIKNGLGEVIFQGPGAEKQEGDMPW